MEADLARRVCVGGKNDNHVRGLVFWAGGKSGGGSSVLDRDSECYFHVNDTLDGNVNNQGEKLSNNVFIKNRDAADVSHGSEHVPMRPIDDDNAL